MSSQLSVRGIVRHNWLNENGTLVFKLLRSYAMQYMKMNSTFCANPKSLAWLFANMLI
jgi:hypothetical protein